MKNPASCGKPQRGVVLFIALIVLVAMTLAGIAMIRSVDTGNIISGNLAFKQSATSGGDYGIEQALTWLKDTTANLQNDNPPHYVANWQDTFDPTGVTATPYTWNDDTSLALPTDAAGNTVRYVIHRMCKSGVGAANAGECAMTSGTGSTQKSTFGSIDYSRGKFGTGTTVYYRITARIEGPRKTYSYVQAMVY